MSIDEFEAVARVSADEMLRWHQRGLLSFDPYTLPPIESCHRIEVEFVSGVVRSGLSDAWVNRILASLRKPYRYDVDQTFYSFARGQWFMIPEDPQTVTDSYIDSLAEANDWATLEALASDSISLHLARSCRSRSQARMYRSCI